MNKFFKKMTPSKETIKNSHGLAFLKKYLGQSCLWQRDRDSIARGVAAGVFVAILPIPMQMAVAAFLAIIVRGNLPMAILFTWLSNPITFFPIVYVIYFVGDLFVGDDNGKKINLNVNWSFDSFNAFWASMGDWLAQFTKAFFIGLPFVAFGSALIAYFVVILLWYIKKHIHFSRKKTN